MDSGLPFYQVEAATWLHLSFLLTVAVFLRFNRIWSLRNLDLALLLSISPGLLMVRESLSADPPTESTFGYVWLFVVSALLLFRLFSDGYFRRRPRVEQNLNSYGLVFLCVVTFVFLMMKVVTLDVDAQTARALSKFHQIVKSPDGSTEEINSQEGKEVGSESTISTSSDSPLTIVAITLTIISHLAVVLALVWVGRYHFNDVHSGIAMATLYLLIPGTAFDVTKMNHVLPAALVLWAFVAYRKPIIAGGLMGLACGTLFFPVFLLPLWMTFYGRKGAIKFGVALIVVGAVLAGSLTLISSDVQAFRQQLGGAIDWSVVSFKTDVATGFWEEHEAAYRIPVFVTFLLMLVVLSIFPRKKNLEHLIAHSTAIIVGTQFWYPQAGGIYLLWYLPLLLVVIFRPRLSQMSPIQKISLSVNVTNANETSPTNGNGKPSELTAARPPSNSLFQ